MSAALICGRACGVPPIARRRWCFSFYSDIEEAGVLLGPLVTTVTHTPMGEVVGDAIRWRSLSEEVAAERDANLVDDRLDVPVALGPRRSLLPKLAVLDRVTVECPTCGASSEVLDERRVLE